MSTRDTDRFEFAAINASSSGDNTVIAAKNGTKFRVMCSKAIAAAGVTVKFKSGSATDITGPMDLVASSGWSDGFAKCGWFETDYGQALVLNLSAAVQVGGSLVYQEIGRKGS